MKKFGYETWYVHDHRTTTGQQYIYRFPNGYGASVVPEVDLMAETPEAVVERLNRDGKLPAKSNEYELCRIRINPATDPVWDLDGEPERHLSLEDVHQELMRIAVLPPREGFTPETEDDIIEPQEPEERFKNLLDV